MSIFGSLSSRLSSKPRRASFRRRQATCRALHLEALEARRLFTVDSAMLACEPVDDIATPASPDAESSGSVAGDEMLYCEPVESYTDEGTTADLGTQEYLLDDSTIDAIVETDLTLTTVEETTAMDTSLSGIMELGLIGSSPVADSSLSAGSTLSGTMGLNLIGPSFPVPVLDLQVTLLQDGIYRIDGQVQHPTPSSVSVVLGGVWEDSGFLRADGTFTFIKVLPSGIIRAVVTAQAFAPGTSSNVKQVLV